MVIVREIGTGGAGIAPEALPLAAGGRVMAVG
jgi:hypothetical protein